jgi:hypothetical protein
MMNRINPGISGDSFRGCPRVSRVWYSSPGWCQFSPSFSLRCYGGPGGTKSVSKVGSEPSRHLFIRFLFMCPYAEVIQASRALGRGSIYAGAAVAAVPVPVCFMNQVQKFVWTSTKVAYMPTCAITCDHVRPQLRKSHLPLGGCPVQIPPLRLPPSTSHSPLRGTGSPA